MRSKFLAAVAAAVALAALVEPSASAARSAGAGGENPAACLGGTVLSAVSAHRLPAGSIAYTYELPNGRSFKSIAPPAGFNPATASDALLAELNLPQRPVGAAARTAWDVQAAPFAKSRISGAGTFCENKSLAEPPEAVAAGPKPAAAGRTAAGVAPAATSEGHYGFLDFSGYELQSGPYEKVVGHFTQPTSDFDSTISNWIGLNGTTEGGNDRLIQAGMDNSGEPFWELYCSGGSSDGCNAAMSGDIDAAPGDDISVSVSFNPATLMSYYAVAVNGAQVVNIEYQMIADSHSGDVADFLTERPAPNLPGVPLYQNVVFSGSRTYTVWNSDTSVPFGSSNYFADEMEDTANGTFYSPPCSNSVHLLMYPSNITSGGFTNNVCSTD